MTAGEAFNETRKRLNCDNWVPLQDLRSVAYGWGWYAFLLGYQEGTFQEEVELKYRKYNYMGFQDAKGYYEEGSAILL